jgi:hypothetical protein
MFPFSFREYLSFTKGVELPALTLAEIVDRKWNADHLRWGHAFEAYLKGELHPFAIEEPDVLPLLKNILEKVIRRDVPSLGKLDVADLPLMEKAVACMESGPRLDEAESMLAPISKTAKQYTIHCVGHAHMDMNWMWSWPETVAVVNDTLSTMVKLLDEFPAFRFSQSQASVYKILEEQGGVRNVEFDFRNKSGEIRTWLFSAERIDIEGKPCLMGVSIDITEHKRMETHSQLWSE